LNLQRLRPGGESAGERGKTHPRLTLLTLDGSQARWPQAADLAKTSDGFGGGCASTGLSKRRRPLSKGPTGPGGVCGAPNGNRKAGGGSTHLPLPPFSLRNVFSGVLTRVVVGKFAGQERRAALEGWHSRRWAGGAADGITCRRQIAEWIRTLSDSTGTRSDRFSCEDCDKRAGGEGGYAMKGEVHPHFLLCVR
jgi:hypothetical protein